MEGKADLVFHDGIGKVMNQIEVLKDMILNRIAGQNIKTGTVFGLYHFLFSKYKKNNRSILVCTFIFFFGIIDENTVWEDYYGSF